MGFFFAQVHIAEYFSRGERELYEWLRLLDTGGQCRTTKWGDTTLARRLQGASARLSIFRKLRVHIACTLM
jgi:hypothetical protein